MAQAEASVSMFCNSAELCKSVYGARAGVRLIRIIAKIRDVTSIIFKIP